MGAPVERSATIWPKASHQCWPHRARQQWPRAPPTCPPLRLPPPFPTRHRGHASHRRHGRPAVPHPDPALRRRLHRGRHLQRHLRVPHHRAPRARGRTAWRLDLPRSTSDVPDGCFPRRCGRSSSRSSHRRSSCRPSGSRRVAGDGAASAFYVANYRFALEGTDYLASVADPSPYQHFWSLAVEEQFYLVWPMVILIAATTERQRGMGVRARRHHRRLVPVLAVHDRHLGAVGILLPADPCLGAGCRRPGRPGHRRSPATTPAAGAGAIGLALVVAGVFLINDTVPYPGTAALMPVVGTALLIIGASDGASLLARGLGSRVPRFFGGISYSLYLWHWPLLILVPIALADDSLGLRVTLGILSIVFAIVSTYVIEAPVPVRPDRQGPCPAGCHGRPRRIDPGGHDRDRRRQDRTGPAGRRWTERRGRDAQAAARPAARPRRPW